MINGKRKNNFIVGNIVRIYLDSNIIVYIYNSSMLQYDNERRYYFIR